MTVVGSGFPSGTEVDIRLGGPNSGVTTELYASTRAAQHGNIQVSFKMPDKWPNGEKIVLPQILVLASTPDFAQKATAMFEFETRVPSTITPSSGAGISTDKK